jgi:hypothetical protein
LLALNVKARRSQECDGRVGEPLLEWGEDNLGFTVEGLRVRIQRLEAPR